jgi:hypothetical protein
MNWIKTKFGGFFISFTVAIVTLEFLSYILVSYSLLLVNERPSLYTGISESGGNVTTKWWTEKELWGAWHQKNSIARHSQSCFSVEYRSNSIGARDDEFSKSKSGKDFVLLGDSFAEGFGVNFEDSAHRIIEKSTGHQLLNFGTAGSVGPLQYWLIYDNLAKKYPHHGLIIFFLPANDFIDNDYDYWLNTKQTFLNRETVQERYRPYYKRNDKNEYDFFIPSNAKKRDNWMAQELNFNQFIVNSFWSANVWRTIKVILLGKSLEKLHQNSGSLDANNAKQYGNSLEKIPPYSGYFDANISQQDAAVYFISKIISTTTAKEILIVSIPVQEDFIRLDKGMKRELLPWWSSFKQLEKISNKDVRFIDLIDFKTNNVQELFHTCDDHWSPKGNIWASDIMSRQLSK